MYENSSKRTDVSTNFPLEEDARAPGSRMAPEGYVGKSAMENLRLMGWKQTSFSGPSSTSGPRFFILVPISISMSKLWEEMKSSKQEELEVG